MQTLRLVAKTLIAATLLGVAGYALAAGPTPQERAQAAVDTRQGVFKIIYHYFGPIVAMARDQIPFDADVVAQNANKISELAKMAPDLFSKDTRQFDVSTDALDKVWTDTDDFNAKAAALAEAAGALAAASANGKGATLKAFGKVGGACKSCHDAYRPQK